MKDIIITSQKIKRERNIYLICFLLSFAINIIAILVYTRPWIEIFTPFVSLIISSGRTPPGVRGLKLYYEWKSYSDL